METGNLRRQFDKFNWVKDDAKLKKWKQGKTGYPIVDAGMRELHETGWMHNRVQNDNSILFGKASYELIGKKVKNISEIAY